MGQYDSVSSTALALITKYGRGLVLKRYSKTFDPVESESSAGTYITQTVQSVKSSMRSNDVAQMSYQLKEMLTKGILEKYLCAAKGLDFTLDVGDVFEIDSKFATIRGLAPLAPSGIPIVYICFVEYNNLATVQKTATLAP